MECTGFRRGCKFVGGTTAVALAALTIFTPTASSAERVVLGEFFTWTNCPSCSLAEPVVDNMVNLYGLDGIDPERSGTFAALTCHLWDSYELPWGSFRAENFYSAIFLGTPMFAHDGIYDAWPISTYVSKFLNRQSVPTPVTMTASAVETHPNRYAVTVETCLEAGASPVDLRIYIILAEDRYPISDPDSGLIHARNYFRSAAPTADISLAPGECVEVSGSVLAAPVTIQDNMRVIAWAQEPNDHWPADVYQAAIIGYPFEPPTPPCPWDCGNEDGEVGINDFLAMLSGWGGPGPCDFDGNDVIDVNDFLQMLGHWGPCPE